MKVYCNQCAVHFPQDFDQTRKPPCNFWGDKGLGTLPDPEKRLIWDWMFSLPADAIAIKYGIGLSFSIGGRAIIKELNFEELVPEWNRLTEEQRQEVERKWFKQQKVQEEMGKQIPESRSRFYPEGLNLDDEEDKTVN